eukprot:CAMPEP_0198314010 /NCGR_PEP_ID=MMETSP1450-20131203/4844_1 /TAXON_ID=753684 ORGANISM="Madagascaria erythrocladiodes, Strain CCMP3234" /NCGR_SAMPLE_ID=MMETSP1450 /ASSEMBLY_ACC=CAM_ASM_001115 /LENGTH=478 /DNA_ID=CAMNT_0044017047 /DNA_START=19 /DNA_END=1455 /DNA_ORIENTATION=+
MMIAVERNQRDFAEASCRETGKTQLEAMLGEVLTTCEKLRWLINNCESCLQPESRSVGAMLHKRAWCEWRPFGVIGIIIPWNYPIHNVFSHVAACIASGNAAVVKVSEWATWSSAYVESVLHGVLKACGLPPELVTFVRGFGDAGAAVVEHVDKVVFIGSPHVGKLVMRAAADTLTPVVLELGGKDPFVVMENADLEHVVDNCLRGAFLNNGQNCIACERVYAYESIYDKFVAAVAARIDLIKCGDWRDAQQDVGAMVMSGNAAKLEALIADAVAKGARVVRGGKWVSGDGQYMQPTLLADCTHDMRVVNEEAFGPIMTVLKVVGDDDDAAVEMANSTEYSLSCSVYSSDATRAEHVARRIYSGMCVVNDFGIAYFVQSLPFGGVRASGFGKFGGIEGLRGLCLTRSFVVDRFGKPAKVPPMLQYPTMRNVHIVVRHIVSLFYGNTLTIKLRDGLWPLLRALVARGVADDVDAPRKQD